jgi:outer membrane receptor protein involved in Fe transport
MIHFAGSWRRCAPPALKRAGIALATLLTCSILTAPVFAQTQTAETQIDVQTIEITGSRIRNADAAAANPITVLSNADIQATGAAQIEDLFQHTVGVDFNGGTNAANNNGGAGISCVGMRNLGVQRTLILLDGQRLIPAGGGCVDLNSIPLAMVDRVEILRDGASSIYGADAIGGVINLITKKKADGLTFESYFGDSGHNDGLSYSVNATAAFQTEKGNLMFGVGRDHTDAIPQANRSWATDTHASDPNSPGSSSYRNQISDGLQDENSNAIYLNGNTYGRNTDCATITAQTYGNTCINGSTKLNASAWQTLTSELEHNEIFASGHYNITDNIQFNASGFYTQRNSEQLLRPEPILGDTIATNVFPGFIIPANYPGNTSGGALTAYLTPSQFGPRDYRQTSDTSRLRSSFSGTFFSKYDWEVGYVWQRNDTTTQVFNEGNFYNLAQLLGETTCVNVPTGCTAGLPTTPVNFFNAPFTVNPWLKDYLTFDNITTSQEVERYAFATINGDIYELPAGTAKFAIGGELRHEGFTNTPNELVIEGWGPNQQNPTAGGYDVGSGYAEVNIPVLADLPGVKSFNVDLSYRYDNYSTFAGASTWKGGFDWAATEDLRLRGSFSKGFRAPQILELFGGTVISDNAASGDPCETNPNNIPAYAQNGNFGKGVIAPGTTCAAVAAKVGKNVTQFTDTIDNTPNNQQQVLTGSNANLKPEESHQFTLGTVITPRWVPGLTMAIDYYNVRITNTVLDGGIAGFLGADAVLDGCYGSAQNQGYCALITRNAAGQITLINGLNTNFGTEKTQGIDFDLAYERPARQLYIPLDGNFKFSLLATLQFQLKQTLPDGSVANNVGTYTPGSNAFDPRWKGIFNAEYAEGSFGIHFDERYMEHMQNFYDSNEVYGNYSPDMWYTDMSAYYNFTDIPYVKNVKFTIGMDNVFDKDPPWMNGSSADSVCKCGTIAGGYDEIGRYMYFRISSAL